MHNNTSLSSYPVRREQFRYGPVFRHGHTSGLTFDASAPSTEAVSCVSRQVDVEPGLDLCKCDGRFPESVSAAHTVSVVRNAGQHAVASHRVVGRSSQIRTSAHIGYALMML